jgi:SNF2 family DNA or RNA helicase
LRQLLEVCAVQGLSSTEEFKRVADVVRRGYFYDPVMSSTSGFAEVMDIEVDDPSHSFVGNGIVNHNTLQLLAALCYQWEKEPDNKAIVVTPKSALRQWAGEVEKFTIGIDTYVVSGKPEERKAMYEKWAAAPTGPNERKAILLVNYAILVRDWDVGGERPLLPNGQPDPKKPVSPGLLDRITANISRLVVTYDEATAFKNTGTKTWQVCRQLSDRAKRCYGLTATLLKNNLMEGFSIYKVIQPTVFTTKTKFMDEFCVVKLQPVGGGRKVPVVVGYRNLDHFRRLIDPFFLGRQKHMVSSELPKLITRQIVCEMSPSEDAKYAEALSGVLELGDGETKEYQETAALTSLIYCQQVVDSLHLLRFEEGQEITVGLFKDESVKVKDKGAKEEALLDLITGELDDEKVIVYTRFEKLVGRLQTVLTAAGVKSVRITGKEGDVKRREAQQAFQDLGSDTKVIFITDAGSEAINLQAASALVFYDAPWSWGTYVQLLGRPIRIGSIHDTVVAYHIVAERPKGKYKSNKTIDHHVLQLLGSKKHLVDKVLGEAAVGALTFNKDEAGGNATRELLRLMKENK